MFQIKNDTFCLNISNIGAELEKLWVHDVNILWEKNDLWSNQSPILFPIVGRMKDGYYLYNHQKYEIPPHGFIKEQSFEASVIQKDFIRLTSTYNEKTLKMYPFRYEFSITYALLADRIKIGIEIKNLDDKEMYFSCGLHPGFSYQGLQELLGDFRYEFDPTLVKSVSFDPCYVTDIQEQRLQSTLQPEELSKQLEQAKTLCYQGLSHIALRSKTKILKINNSMPYTAFWQAMPNQPKFICIEPWYGLPDDVHTNHELIQKRDILTLMPGKTFETHIEISIMEA